MSIFTSLVTVLHHPYNRGRFWRALAITGWWKLNQWFFHLLAVVEIAPGVRIICDPRNSYGSFIVYALWPEYEELAFIYTYLGLGDTYIDVGAHIGDSSLLAAAKIKTGQVIACEPTPAVFNDLKTNIKLNNFEAIITPVQKAVSDQIGTTYFTLEAASEVNHLQLVAGEGKSIPVSTTTIDQLIKEYKLQKVTLLKIDVEGFELEVIRGAQKALREQKIELILFEVNPRSVAIQDKVKQIQQLLETFSFSFYSFSESGQLTPVPDLFVPTKTSNFLAVSLTQKKSSSFKKWLK